LSELAGASLVMSIHPAYQEAFLTNDFAREPRIDSAIAADVLGRLRELPEFVRAYEPDGMTPAEFIEYGLTQRTLSQFSEAGWKQLESCR
jgi:transaldolase